MPLKCAAIVPAGAGAGGCHPYSPSTCRLCGRVPEPVCGAAPRHRCFYAAAAKKFAGRDDVKLLHGDSGEMIGKVLASLKTPALFWLDAHYSGDGTAHGPLETPIIAEMKQVLDHPVRGHVVLIDDARFFDGTEDYPTLQQVEQLVSTFSSKCRFEVLHDVIRVTPA